MDTDSDTIKRLTIFDMSGFFQFVKSNNILVFIIAAVLSSYFNEFATGLNNYIVMPLLGGLFDVKELEKKKMHIGNAEMEVGKMILLIIKCLLIVIIVLLSYELFLHSIKS